MKFTLKPLTVLCLLYMIFLTGCGPSINTTTGYRSAFEQHQTIAILPFDVRFNLNKSDKKTFTDQQMTELKRYLSNSLQEHLATWLRASYSKRPPRVNILDIDAANEILGAKKISYATLFTMDKKKIPALLGVDAVLFSETVFGKPMNQANSNLGSFIYGNSLLGFGLTSDDLDLKISIHEKDNDSTLWSYRKLSKITANNLSQKEYPRPKNEYQEILFPLFAMIDPAMKKFVKVFPYKDIR